MFSNIVTQQPAARLPNISLSVQNRYDIHAEQPHAMTYETYSGAAPSCIIPPVSRMYPQLNMRPGAFSDMPPDMPMKPADRSTGGIAGILENISRRLRCTGLCTDTSDTEITDDQFNTKSHDAPIALATMPSRTCSEPDLRERTDSAASIASSHAEHIKPVTAQMHETALAATVTTAIAAAATAAQAAEATVPAALAAALARPMERGLVTTHAANTRQQYNKAVEALDKEINEMLAKLEILKINLWVEAFPEPKDKSEKAETLLPANQPTRYNEAAKTLKNIWLDLRALKVDKRLEELRVSADTSEMAETPSAAAQVADKQQKYNKAVKAHAEILKELYMLNINKQLEELRAIL